MKHSRRLNKKIKKSKILRGGKNLFATDESLLTNEQKFINSLYTKLLQYNSLSVINLALTHYNEKNVLDIVADINGNAESRSWFQVFFDSLWNCFRIFNLKHFLTDYIYNELYKLKKEKSRDISEIEKTKPLMTFDELNKFIIKFTELNGPLNKTSLIVNSITLYLQNQNCLHEGGKRIQNGGGWGLLIIIGLLLAAVFGPSPDRPGMGLFFRLSEDPREAEDQRRRMGIMEEYAYDRYIAE
jgi:hypothetical protein